MSIKRHPTKPHLDTRSRRSGKNGIPRWYRREHGCQHVRRVEKIKIQKHMRLGCWETHLPDRRIRDSMYYWWY